MKHRNLWFQPISKTTCDCGEKHTEVLSWGEYRNVHWTSIMHVCCNCFEREVFSRINRLLKSETMEICARSGYTLPNWVKQIWDQKKAA